jgi:hypothetical protein
VTAPIRIYVPVVLAKAKGVIVTSVEGELREEEVSESTGDCNPRGVKCGRLEDAFDATLLELTPISLRKTWLSPIRFSGVRNHERAI